MPLLKLVKSKVDFAKKTEEYYNAIRTNIQFYLYQGQFQEVSFQGHLPHLLDGEHDHLGFHVPIHQPLQGMLQALPQEAH